MSDVPLTSARDALEAAAKIADAARDKIGGKSGNDRRYLVGNEIAAAIRALAARIPPEPPAGEAKELAKRMRDYAENLYEWSAGYNVLARQALADALAARADCGLDPIARERGVKCLATSYHCHLCLFVGLQRENAALRERLSALAPGLWGDAARKATP